MKDFKNISVCGRLGGDIRTFGEGTKAGCSFNIASNGSVKDGDGNWMDKAEWYTVTLFGHNATFAVKNFKKGKRCIVNGEHSTHEYEKNGVPKSSNDIKANEFFILDWEAKDSEKPPF